MYTPVNKTFMVKDISKQDGFLDYISSSKVIVGTIHINNFEAIQRTTSERTSLSITASVRKLLLD
jgi:c-di-AMP phosphodiesterase-like protein